MAVTVEMGAIRALYPYRPGPEPAYSGTMYSACDFTITGTFRHKAMAPVKRHGLNYTTHTYNINIYVPVDIIMLYTGLNLSGIK